MGRSGYETTNLWIVDEPDTPISISSEGTSEIEEDHPLYELKKSFLHVVMAAYMQAQLHKPSHQDPSAVESTAGSFEAIDRGRETGNRPRKRGRSSDCASTIAGEKQSQNVSAKRRAQDRRLWFACPYAKKDPVQYRDCYRYFLGRIRDVKQHITRCHRRPIYCPVCKETFEDEDVKDSHVMSRNCSPCPSILIEGISEKQRKDLGQRVSPKLPEDQQWFAVFDILFSPDPHPKTLYRDRELSEQTCVFQDFMTGRGPALLSDFLEEKGVVTWNLPNEERDLAAFTQNVLQDGLQLIVDQWTTDNSAALEPTNAPHSPKVSQSEDSGISVGENTLSTTTSNDRMMNDQSRREPKDISTHNLRQERQANDLDPTAHILGPSKHSDQRDQAAGGQDAIFLQNLSWGPGANDSSAMTGLLTASQYRLPPSDADDSMLSVPPDFSGPFDFNIDWPT